MERLCHMKDSLISAAQSQLAHLDQVDAKELGEVVDMIKDIEEAIYYCTITKAMKESDKKEEERFRIEQELMKHNNNQGRMFYNGQGSNSNGNGNGNRMYYDGQDQNYNVRYMIPDNIMRNNSYGWEASQGMPQQRSAKEGNSPIMRRYYMESKEAHKGTAVQLKELENYMKELSSDITDMIKDASPEEKVMLQQKLTTLASKIA